jgi:hypothetical protein
MMTTPETLTLTMQKSRRTIVSCNDFNELTVPKDMTETAPFAFDAGSQASNSLGPLCGFQNRVNIPEQTAERQNSFRGCSPLDTTVGDNLLRSWHKADYVGRSIFADRCMSAFDCRPKPTVPSHPKPLIQRARTHRPWRWTASHALPVQTSVQRY